MKKAKNVDDSIKKQFPSTKKAKNVDGSTKNKLPSTKKAKNVDDSMTDMPSDHKERTLEITSFLFPV